MGPREVQTAGDFETGASRALGAGPYV